MIDPLISLSFPLHVKKGAYALLLGGVFPRLTIDISIRLELSRFVVIVLEECNLERHASSCLV